MLKLKNGEKLNIGSTTKAEEVLVLIDWDDFNFKDWRFLYNIVCGYMEDGVEKDRVQAEMDKHLTIEKAEQEVIRVVGKENFDKFVAPVVKYLKDEERLEAWRVRDCLYGGLTSSIVDTCKEDAEMWKMFFTQCLPVKNNDSFGGLNG